MVGSTTGTHIWDRKVIVPEPTFDMRYATEHSVARILVGGRSDPPASGLPESTVPAVASAAPVSSVRSAITRLLLRRHAGAQNFELDDAAGQAQERLILTVIELLLVATGALALFVGGINVMNVMFVRVAERKREIGLRRALGATRGAILALFLAESTLLASFGGLLGISLGSALTALAAAAMGQVFGGFPLVIPGLALALGAGLALFVGVLSGLLPAWQAARLDPVAALR
jgi:putative ABC transport system permease protein